MTCNLRVSAEQLPVRVAIVIERGWLPLIVVMTLAALAAEPPSMCILPLMTAEAVLRHLFLEIPAAMTVLTVDVGVHAFEGESGLLAVIELVRLPTRGRMAVTAFRSAVAAVHVIRGMA